MQVCKTLKLIGPCSIFPTSCPDSELHAPWSQNTYSLRFLGMETIRQFQRCLLSFFFRHPLFWTFENCLPHLAVGKGIACLPLDFFQPSAHPMSWTTVWSILGLHGYRWWRPTYQQNTELENICYVFLNTWSTVKEELLTFFFYFKHPLFLHV